MGWVGGSTSLGHLSQIKGFFLEASFTAGRGPHFPITGGFDLALGRQQWRRCSISFEDWFGPTSATTSVFKQMIIDLLCLYLRWFSILTSKKNPLKIILILSLALRSLPKLPKLIDR